MSNKTMTTTTNEIVNKSCKTVAGETGTAMAPSGSKKDLDKAHKMLGAGWSRDALEAYMEKLSGTSTDFLEQFKETRNFCGKADNQVLTEVSEAIEIIIKSGIPSGATDKAGSKRKRGDDDKCDGEEEPAKRHKKCQLEGNWRDHAMTIWELEDAIKAIDTTRIRLEASLVQYKSHFLVKATDKKTFDLAILKVKGACEIGQDHQRDLVGAWGDDTTDEVAEIVGSYRDSLSPWQKKSMGEKKTWDEADHSAVALLNKTYGLRDQAQRFLVILDNIIKLEEKMEDMGQRSAAVGADLKKNYLLEWSKLAGKGAPRAKRVGKKDRAAGSKPEIEVIEVIDLTD